MSGPRNRSENQPVEIDFVGIYYALRAQLPLLLILGLIGLIGSGIYLMIAPRLYHSQAMIQIEQAERRVVKIEDLDEQNLESLEALKTLEMNLSNWTLLSRVVKNPKLNLTPASLGLPARRERPYSDVELLSKLARCISVELVRGTRLIKIDAEVGDPVVAGMLPTLVVEEYKNMTLEQHVALGREASSFLMGEVESLRAKLERSKKALQDYRESTGAVALEDSRNTVDASLRDLNLKLTEAKALRLRIESDNAQVKVLDKNRPDALLNISSIANSPAVLEQKKLVTAQEAELANRSQRYLPKHPRYIEARSKLDELRSGLNRALVLAADGNSMALEAAKATEAKLEQALQEQEKKSLELSRKLITYEALAREAESDNALYQSVLSRLKETDVMKGINPEIVRLVQPSVVPTVSSKPRRKLILAGGLAAGLALGFSLALCRIVLDRSLKTVDQAEGFLDLSVLGSIPGRSPRGKWRALPMIDEPAGAIAEGFRTLRTALALIGESGERRTFLFTSAVQGEGKTFAASNFAVSLAQQGQRTLLIDADLRVPALGRIFFDQKPHPGVADILDGRANLATSWRESGTPNLAVLTAGNRPHHTAELLTGPKFGRLLEEACSSFDCVVLDSAPVNAVSDTLLLVKLVHSVCLVVHSTRTPRNAVLRARNKLREAGAPLAGIVLNRLPRSSGQGYHFHYSSGSYGEGVYGVADKRFKAA